MADVYSEEAGPAVAAVGGRRQSAVGRAGGLCVSQCSISSIRAVVEAAEKGRRMRGCFWSGARTFFRNLILWPGGARDSGLKQWRRMEVLEPG